MKASVFSLLINISKLFITSWDPASTNVDVTFLLDTWYLIFLNFDPLATFEDTANVTFG